MAKQRSSAPNAKRIQEAARAREAEQEAFRQKRKAEIEGRHDEAVAKAAKAKLRLMKRQSRQAYLENGGDPDSFEADWEGHLKAAVIQDAVTRRLRETLPQVKL